MCRLVIGQTEVERLLEHAEASLPLEAVALLFGIVREGMMIVKRMELLDNAARSETTFLVDPGIQYQLLVESERRGEEIVCVFHSHPAPPRPSLMDLKNMNVNPVVWLIASKITGRWQYKAFLLNAEKEPKEVEIVNP